MKKKYLLSILSILLISCAGILRKRHEGDALKIKHSPNPSAIHKSEYFKKEPYPYMWFYKTEIKNSSNRELKIIWFESYFEFNESWYGLNVLNRPLRNDVFMKWYGNENDTFSTSEWLKPGEIRVCNLNWHGSSDPKGHRVKWSYIAIDRYGNDYYGEAIIESIPIE
ncbi:MAG: hypothetical protein ACMUJM_25495 [bacterium]